jgi:hypothetical protein
MNSFVGTNHEVSVGRLVGVVDILVTDPAGSTATAVGPAPSDVLLCTHGSRERCCGRFGTQLLTDVAPRWDGVRVRRTSHTGGHRDASTWYSFREGRA